MCGRFMEHCAGVRSIMMQNSLIDQQPASWNLLSACDSFVTECLAESNELIGECHLTVAASAAQPEEDDGGAYAAVDAPFPSPSDDSSSTASTLKFRPTIARPKGGVVDVFTRGLAWFASTVDSWPSLAQMPLSKWRAHLQKSRTTLAAALNRDASDLQYPVLSSDLHGLTQYIDELLARVTTVLQGAVIFDPLRRIDTRDAATWFGESKNRVYIAVVLHCQMCCASLETAPRFFHVPLQGAEGTAMPPSLGGHKMPPYVGYQRPSRSAAGTHLQCVRCGCRVISADQLSPQLILLRNFALAGDREMPLPRGHVRIHDDGFPSAAAGPFSVALSELLAPTNVWPACAPTNDSGVVGDRQNSLDDEDGGCLTSTRNTLILGLIHVRAAVDLSDDYWRVREAADASNLFTC